MSEHLRAEQLAAVLRPFAQASGGASASPVQRALWSQRLGGPCGARWLRLLRITPVPERMLESLDSSPWLPGLMRPLPSRFEWSGVTRGRRHWCVGDGIRPAGEGIRRDARRSAWWRGPGAAHDGQGSTRRATSRGRKYPSIPSFLMSSHFLCMCTGFYGVRPVRYRFDHLSKVVKEPFWGGLRGATERPNGAKLCRHVEETG